VWGSDFPFLAPRRCLDELAGLGLPDEVLRQVLCENAARILRLP
jgi:predicted TIM-barrel fold metal-dependent hydrolase